MTLQNEFKSVCSVAELARKLGLSRSRFYELQEIGVFPTPVYCIHKKRPFYTHDMQQLCMDIRDTGMGFNEMPTIFYAARRKKTSKANKHSTLNCRDTIETLKQTGIKVTEKEIIKAMRALYPAKLNSEQDKGIMIRDLFKYFSGKQNSV